MAENLTAPDDQRTDERGVPPHARGYDRHPGRIGRTVQESQRAWPRAKRAPEGSPNVIVVMLDDMGYSDIGPFGSEIDTPHLDRLAASGVRMTNYHTPSVCSPARAALLTGLNPHRAGFSGVANSDPGFPGTRLEIDEDVLTMPEVMRANGYATYAVGKWHLTRDALMNDAADRSTWPIARGFDRYYGSAEGCNNFFHPSRLIVDNSSIDLGDVGDDYYLTDDLTEQAVKMIKGLRANDAHKPFFLYFAHVAMHGPLGVKEVDLAKYRGKYAAGWDELRQQRHARQIAEGLFPADMPLPPRDGGLARFDVPAWDSLTAEQQDLYARHMEVYAAMVDNVDQSLGRLMETLTDLGELDNTLILFTSDNGGTMEGGPEGTRSYLSRFLHVHGLPQDWDRDRPIDPELIGGPQVMSHYPRGWGMVSNTPFRFYKGQTFAGGVRVPFVLSWPAGLARPEGDDGLRPQYQYATDVLPTIVDLLDLQVPTHRHGLAAQEIDGISFGSVLRERSAPATRTEQYAEYGGNRGFYRDGWKILTTHVPGTPIDDAEWELYHVESDPNELVDLSASEPAKRAEMAAAWEHAAWANTVFPMINRGILELAIRRPDEDELARPVRLLPGTPKLERYRSLQLIHLRDFDVEIALHHRRGDEGVLVCHGDQGGGYLVYLENERLALAYNEYGILREQVAAAPLPEGEHVITLQARVLPDFRWRMALVVDGAEVAVLEEVMLLAGMAPFSGIEVGRNSSGPVHWDLFRRRRTFPFTGALESVTYIPGAVADYDPALVLAAEREAAAAFD